jgi:type II secretory pathway pseudopilin PulG
MTTLAAQLRAEALLVQQKQEEVYAQKRAKQERKEQSAAKELEEHLDALESQALVCLPAYLEEMYAAGSHPRLVYRHDLTSWIKEANETLSLEITNTSRLLYHDTILTKLQKLYSEPGSAIHWEEVDGRVKISLRGRPESQAVDSARLIQVAASFVEAIVNTMTITARAGELSFSQDWRSWIRLAVRHCPAMTIFCHYLTASGHAILRALVTAGLHVQGFEWKENTSIGITTWERTMRTRLKFRFNKRQCLYWP